MVCLSDDSLSDLEDLDLIDLQGLSTPEYNRLKRKIRKNVAIEFKQHQAKYCINKGDQIGAAD